MAPLDYQERTVFEFAGRAQSWALLLTLSSPMPFLTTWNPGMGTEDMYTTHPSEFYLLDLGPLLGAPQL